MPEETGWGLRKTEDYVEDLAARNGIALGKGGCATLVAATFVAVAFIMLSFIAVL